MESLKPRGFLNGNVTLRFGPEVDAESIGTKGDDVMSLLFLGDAADFNRRAGMKGGAREHGGSKVDCQAEVRR